MVQDITTQSWGSRIKNAFAGIIIGFILIISAFVLIFWNEGQGLHKAQSLEQTQQVLISIPASPVDAKNNSQVVYFSGEAKTDEVLEDPLFGISEEAISLSRQVTMYQWREEIETKTESEMGGGEKQVKTYSYKPIWSAELIDSNQFKDPNEHKNPSKMLLQSKYQYAQKVHVGDFVLPEDLIKQINRPTAIDLSKVNLEPIKARLHKPVQFNEDGLYVGDDPLSAKIGDMKITFSKVVPQTVSIIAQQTENGLQPYLAPAGEAVMLLVVGKESPEQIILAAKRENNTQMWMFRLISLIMMVLGIALILRPLAILADIIPLIGSIVGFGTGIIAFAGGLLLWAVGLAIAWFAVRPLWAIGLLIIVIGFCYFLIKRKRLSKIS